MPARNSHATHRCTDRQSVEPQLSFCPMGFGFISVSSSARAPAGLRANTMLRF
jgi:hypothetical protein